MSGVQWTPPFLDEAATAINGTVFRQDSSAEICATSWECPRDGNIEGFEFFLATVTVAPGNGLTCSIQAVDTGTGLNSGTPLQSFVTSAGQPSAAGWISGTFGSVQAVTRGEIYHFVIAFTPTYTTGDICVGVFTGSVSSGFPYAIRQTNTKDQTLIPIIVARYDDGTYSVMGLEQWAVTQITSVSMQTDTTFIEAGLSFTVDTPQYLRSVAFKGRGNSANNSCNIKIYDADGTTVLNTTPHDWDLAPSVAGPYRFRRYLTEDVLLTPGNRYRAVLAAGSATLNTELWYGVFPSLAVMDAIENGQDAYMTAKKSADGLWTDYNNGTDGYRKPQFHLGLVPAESSGGGTVFIPQGSPRFGIGVS